MSFLQLVLSFDKTIKGIILLWRICQFDRYRNTNDINLFKFLRYFNKLNKSSKNGLQPQLIRYDANVETETQNQFIDVKCKWDFRQKEHHGIDAGTHTPNCNEIFKKKKSNDTGLCHAKKRFHTAVEDLSVQFFHFYAVFGKNYAK